MINICKQNKNQWLIYVKKQKSMINNVSKKCVFFIKNQQYIIYNIKEFAPGVLQNKNQILEKGTYKTCPQTC